MEGSNGLKWTSLVFRTVGAMYAIVRLSSSWGALRSGEEVCKVWMNGEGPERDDEDDLDREDEVCISNTSSESESESSS